MSYSVVESDGMIAYARNVLIFLAAAGAAAQPSIKLEKIIVLGAMSKEVVRKVATHHEEGLLSCYRQALKHRSALQGNVTIRFTASPIGFLSKVSVEESNLKYNPMHRCLVHELKGWRFPSAMGGGIYHFRCSWKFETKTQN